MAAILSVLAAGCELDPGDGTSGSDVGLRVRVDDGFDDGGPATPGLIELPRCRGELEGPSPEGPFLDELRATESADPLGSILPTAIDIDRSFFGGGGRGRPVLFASPGLGASRFLGLIAFTLLRRVAWVLEPQVEAFVATVLWARPTVLIARPGDLRTLVGHFDRAAQRQSRLRAILVVEAAVVEATVVEATATEATATEAAVEDRLADAERQEMESHFGLPLASWPAPD